MAKRGRPKGSKNKKKNISHNFRGKEDVFWSKIVKGVKNFLQSPFK